MRIFTLITLVALPLSASHAEIYRCLSEGLHSYQQTPCNNGESIVVNPGPENSINNPYRNRPWANIKDSSKKLRPSTKHYKKTSAAKRAKIAKKRQCEQHQEKFDYHRAKMRNGYTASESNKMLEKERTLKKKVQQLCR